MTGKKETLTACAWLASFASFPREGTDLHGLAADLNRARQSASNGRSRRREQRAFSFYRPGEGGLKMTPVHKNSAPCPQLFTHMGTMGSPSWHAFCRVLRTFTHLRKCEPCLKIIEKSFLTLPPISVQCRGASRARSSTPKKTTAATCPTRELF